MAAIDENQNDKVFQHYEELLPELRMMIVDSMEPADRCRFTRCSSLSKKEVMSSKTAIHSITLHISSKNEIKIYVRNAELGVHGHTGYCLEFKKEHAISYMIYKNRRDEQIWWKTISPSVWFRGSEVEQHAFQQFKKLMELHQKNIKVLSIKVEAPDVRMNFDNFNFGITRMNQLKELEINGNFNYHQFISRTLRPLKKLKIIENNFFENSLEQIFQVYDDVSHENLRLTKDQFLRLSARSVHIHIGQLTVMDVVNFIRSWQNGTVGKKLKEVFWKLGFSGFNMEELFRTLGYVRYIVFSPGATVEIKHSEDPSKSVEVRYFPGELRAFFHGDFDDS